MLTGIQKQNWKIKTRIMINGCSVTVMCHGIYFVKYLAGFYLQLSSEVYRDISFSSLFSFLFSFLSILSLFIILFILRHALVLRPFASVVLLGCLLPSSVSSDQGSEQLYFLRSDLHAVPVPGVTVVV